MEREREGERRSLGEGEPQPNGKLPGHRKNRKLGGPDLSLPAQFMYMTCSSSF